MASNDIGIVIERLYTLSKSKGYLSFDNILNSIDEFDLPLDDVDRITDKLLTMGIIIRDDDTHSISQVEDDDYSERSKVDYNTMFDEILLENPSLSRLIMEVRRIPPPQYKEIDTLIYQSLDGNKYAYDRIIKMYLRVVIRTAYLLSKQYFLPLEDTIQDGVLGLIAAYNAFDPSSDKRFSTQIGWSIRNSIMREAQTINNQIYFPYHVKENLFSIYDIVLSHQCEYCKEFTICKSLIAEVSAHLEIDGESARTYISYLNFSEDIDDFEFDDNDVFSKEIVENLFISEINSKVIEVLDKLDDRTSLVLKSRYGLINGEEKTLEEIGAVLNVTRERIRQIEAKGLRRIRSNKEIQKLAKWFN